MRMSRPTLLVALAVAAAAALTACAPTSSGPARPTPASTAPASTPAPTPDQGPSAAAVVVDGDGFDVVDTAGVVVFEHAWADEVDPAVAALTDAFGSVAETSFEDGDDTHVADYDVYTWGGFALGDAVGLEQPREDYFLPSWVRVETAAVGDVAIRSRSGLGVGSSVAEVAAVEPVVREQADAATPAVYRIDAADPSLTLEQLSPPADPTDMVGLVADAADAVIVRLAAPELSWYPF